MTTSRRDFIRASAAATATAGFANLGMVGSAFAQGSAAPAPLAQLRILCGFPPGDTMDMVTRHYAEKLRGTYANVVLVENKPGAGGRIAVDALKSAPKDGSTLLFTPSAMLIVYPHVFQKLSYDPLKDTVPVSRISDIVYSLSVGPMVPASVQNVTQFLEWCRANPKLASYGISAPGAPFHLIAESLSKSTNTPMTAVAYKGGTAAAQDVIAGQIPATFSTPSTVIEHYKKGTVRILAVSSPTRWPHLPNVPTFTEQGYPNAGDLDWFGVFAPEGTPPAILAQANAAIRKAGESPEVINGAKAISLVAATSPSVEEFTRQFKVDYDRWGAVVKSINFPKME
ncbi:Twin-arginine translocation pathway signal protein [Burkholderiales bacterium 8X]|nr:Twin-arginine translocation pathway signal protein [Burkholderiales bacterium 8X]